MTVWGRSPAAFARSSASALGVGLPEIVNMMCSIRAAGTARRATSLRMARPRTSSSPPRSISRSATKSTDVGVGLPASRNKCPAQGVGDHSLRKVLAALRFALGKPEGPVGLDYHPDEVVATEGHFSAVLVAEATHGNAVAEAFLHQFSCKDFAEVDTGSGLSLRPTGIALGQYR